MKEYRKVRKTWTKTGKTEEISIDQAVTEILASGSAPEDFVRETFKGGASVDTPGATYLPIEGEVDCPERESGGTVP